MNIKCKMAGAFVLAIFFAPITFSQSAKNDLELVCDSLHIPPAKTMGERIDPVIVAVVDDAFRFSHKELKGFLYQNPAELKGNQLDDDGNDYTDDISGWDIADNDNDVSVCEGREKEFYHGTFVASLISKIARLHYGDKAQDKIKIMPVKVLSDQASPNYLKDGYKGIKYAMDNGADVICLAWSGGHPGKEQMDIIREAHRKGILLVGAVGNFNDENILYPALLPEILAVAGIDKSMGKYARSNYGMQVDISAPAESVLGAHPEKDNAYVQDDGTSAATALVAGCAAILMSKQNDVTNRDIKEALLNSSTPFSKSISTYGGKLGAGIVNLEKALDYLSVPMNRANHFSSLRSKGTICTQYKKDKQVWEIEPVGGYSGFYLEPDASAIRKVKNQSFQILVNDTLWNEYQLSNLPAKLFVPASSLTINLSKCEIKKKDVFKINYYGKTIDSTKLYCHGIHHLSAESGVVTDGSGENNYTNNSTCRWIINVPVGKRVKFTFDKMSTQGNVDFVYLIDGETAIPENIFAKFSGENKPPVVVSRTNKVLVWFVVDSSVTGKGWKFHYETID